MARSRGTALGHLSWIIHRATQTDIKDQLRETRDDRGRAERDEHVHAVMTQEAWPSSASIEMRLDAESTFSLNAATSS